MLHAKAVKEVLALGRLLEEEKDAVDALRQLSNHDYAEAVQAPLGGLPLNQVAEHSEPDVAAAEQEDDETEDDDRTISNYGGNYNGGAGSDRDEEGISTCPTDTDHNDATDEDRDDGGNLFVGDHGNGDGNGNANFNGNQGYENGDNGAFLDLPGSPPQPRATSLDIVGSEAAPDGQSRDQSGDSDGGGSVGGGSSNGSTSGRSSSGGLQFFRRQRVVGPGVPLTSPRGRGEDARVNRNPPQSAGETWSSWSLEPRPSLHSMPVAAGPAPEAEPRDRQQYTSVRPFPLSRTRSSGALMPTVATATASEESNTSTGVGSHSPPASHRSPSSFTAEASATPFATSVERARASSPAAGATPSREPGQASVSSTSPGGAGAGAGATSGGASSRFPLPFANVITVEDDSWRLEYLGGVYQPPVRRAAAQAKTRISEISAGETAIDRSLLRGRTVAKKSTRGRGRGRRRGGGSGSGCSRSGSSCSRSRSRSRRCAIARGAPSASSPCDSTGEATDASSSGHTDASAPQRAGVPLTQGSRLPRYSADNLPFVEKEELFVLARAGECTRKGCAFVREDHCHRGPACDCVRSRDAYSLQRESHLIIEHQKEHYARNANPAVGKRVLVRFEPEEGSDKGSVWYKGTINARVENSVYTLPDDSSDEEGDWNIIFDDGDSRKFYVGDADVMISNQPQPAILSAKARKAYLKHENGKELLETNSAVRSAKLAAINARGKAGTRDNSYIGRICRRQAPRSTPVVPAMPTAAASSSAVGSASPTPRYFRLREATLQL